MSEILSIVIAVVGALAAAAIMLVTVLSLRALRRGAELEAEMRAASFAFRLHLRPQVDLDERSKPVPSHERTRR